MEFVDDAVAIGNGKVEQTSSVDIFVLQDTLGDRIGHLVDLGDGTLYGFSKNCWTKTGFGASAWVVAKSLEGIEKESKRPFAVGAALDAQVPLVGQALTEASLDVFPSTESSIMHPHQASMCKRMTVVFA
ncbi:hypothetical protein HG531_006323 [Fusarium graminearum]|nr:hypothetical protein HG531_006323 [Fusarium graminearum]